MTNQSLIALDERQAERDEQPAFLPWMSVALTRKYWTYYEYREVMSSTWPAVPRFVTPPAAREALEVAMARVVAAFGEVLFFPYTSAGFLGQVMDDLLAVDTTRYGTALLLGPRGTALSRHVLDPQRLRLLFSGIGITR